MAALPVDQKGWEQRTADREPRPDESRARLTITVGDHDVEIWEWFPELKSNRRIVKIRSLMEEIAWEAPARSPGISSVTGPSNRNRRQRGASRSPPRYHASKGGGGS